MFAERDAVVDALRGGESIAIGIAEVAARRRFLDGVERELTASGRETISIDLTDAPHGHEIAGRFVEAVLPFLDLEELGDILEAVPGRGRLDVEVLAALMMLPERVAAARGRRTVAILDGFESVELATGFVGLAAVRDALTVRSRATYLFAGGRRVPTLFTRTASPLVGLARVVEPGAPRVVAARPASPLPSPTRVAPAADPLAAALLAWASPPPPPEKSGRTSEPTDAWRRLLAEEEAARRWLADQDDDEPGDERRDRRRRRRR